MFPIMRRSFWTWTSNRRVVQNGAALSKQPNTQHRERAGAPTTPTGTTWHSTTACTAASEWPCRANIGTSISNDIHGVHGLKTFGKRSDDGLPFLGVNAMNIKIHGWFHPLAQKTSQTVAHHAVRIDQDSGLGHGLTRCVLLPMH